MKIEVDLHTHTQASGHAYSTVREMARMAASRKLRAVAFTDHGPSMPGAPHPYHFSGLRSLPDYLEGVRVLRGAEANIVDAAGRLDLDDQVLQTLDLVAIGFHPEAGYASRGRDGNTETMLRAMRNPWVDLLVHPCNRNYPVDIEAVVAGARETGVILELNNRSFRGYMGGTRDSREQCLEMARAAKSQRVFLAANSDAHCDEEVGSCEAALEIAIEAGLGGVDLINASYERLAAHLQSRKNQALVSLAG